MSIVLVGSTSGSCTLQEQAVAGNTVLTLPTVSGTILTTGSSGQSIPKAALPTGSVLQVVNYYNNGFSIVSTSSTSPTATGIIASITPTASSSKVLILVSGTNFYNLTAGGENYLYVYRQIGGGSYTNPATNFLQIAGVYGTGANFRASMAISYVDSPATTSQCNYQLYLATNGTGTATFSTPNLSITLLEIAA